ncbi:TPA: EAL domain-containing protein [Pseudomonas aeruginosa]|nr:EAL domain-containing protein [Pseudomonas aeruginosa]HEP8853865.1 EAL domain-containing protein [Pseudomonas aeruginosa]
MISKKDVCLGLRRKEFLLYLQPKFDLSTGEFVGAESLLRWAHPELGLLLPADFLDIVVENGFIDDVFFEIMDQGLTAHRYCKVEKIPLKLAFNIHPIQLSDIEFSVRISSALRKHGVSASNISFELTELDSWDDDLVAFDNLYNIHLLGCGLSIDDFGVGYSSLRRLADLPFTEIKVDASFVADILVSPRCSDIVEWVLALAKNLEITVVAEGIETVGQFNRLQAMGCPYGQGYFYSKPLGLDEMLSWLKEGEGRAWSLL